MEVALDRKRTYACNRPHRVMGVQESSPLTWHPSGRYFAFVAGNNSIQIVEERDEKFKIRHTLMGHHSQVSTLAFHPDKPLLASAGAEGAIVWMWKEAKIVQRINESAMGRSAHEGHIEDILWVASGSVLVTAGRDSQIKMWDALAGYRLMETLTAHKAPVLSIAYHAGSTTFASAGRDSSIKLWDAKTLSPSWREKRSDDGSIKVVQISALDGHRGDITTIRFDHSGEYLFSGARDNEIRVWYLPSNHLMRTIKGHSGDVQNLTLLKKGALLLTASMDATVKLWELAKQDPPKIVEDILTNQQEITEDFFGQSQELLLDKAPQDKLVVSIPAHERDITAMAVNPKYPFMVTSTSYNAVRVWNITNLTKPEKISEFVGHSKPISQVVIFNGGRNMLTASEDYNVFMYDIDTVQRIGSFSIQGSVFSIAVNPTEDLLFVSGTDYDIAAFSIAPDARGYLKQVASLEGHCGKVTTLAVAPQGKILVSGGHDFNLMSWNVRDNWEYKETMQGGTGRMKAVPTIESPKNHVDAHSGHVQEIAFSQDGTMMATVSSDHSVIVWKMNSSGTSFSQTWESERGAQHSSVVACCTWGKQGSGDLLFTGGWDHTIRVWKPKSGKPNSLHVIEGHDARLTALDVTADGEFLVSSSADYTIRLWQINHGFSCLVKYSADSSEGAFNTVSAGYDTFITGSDSGMVSVWPLPVPEFADSFKTDRSKPTKAPPTTKLFSGPKELTLGDDEKDGKRSPRSSKQRGPSADRRRTAGSTKSGGGSPSPSRGSSNKPPKQSPRGSSGQGLKSPRSPQSGKRSPRVSRR